MTIDQIETKAVDVEEKETLIVNAMAWKKKASISKRMLKEGETLAEGLLKDNVKVVECVYIAGIGRMRYGELRSLMKGLGVDTTRIKDMNFVKGKVGAFLVDKDYKAQMVKALVFEGSSLSIIKGFNPLDRGHFKRSDIGSRKPHR